MKNFLNITVILLVNLSFLKGQSIDDISSKSIKEAIPVFKEISNFENTDNIDLLGLGDIAEFAKESKKANTAFAAYLITNKEFRNIVLPVDDWLLRPINAYLTSSLSVDSAIIDSLAKTFLSLHLNYRSQEFRSFMLWLKEFNTTHQDDIVQLYGVAPLTNIPASYFLSNYVYIVDENYGRALSKKWSDSAPSDSALYSDIFNWVEKQKYKKLSDEDKALIAKCEYDLLHNRSIVKIDSLNQKFPKNVLNSRSRYIADRILEKTKKKTIFFGANTEVATTQLKAPFVIEDQAISSVGSFLKSNLKDRYYVFVTDFANSARLPIVNISTQSMDIEAVPGSEKAKQLRLIGQYFTHTDHSNLLTGYEPSFFSTFSEMKTTPVTAENQPSIDALFLFSKVTEIDLFN